VRVVSASPPASAIAMTRRRARIHPPSSRRRIVRVS
jgi:hypothetical protein